jgi:hypothetical protein
MKAYLITTGAIFGLLAAAHLLRTIEEWRLMPTDPWLVLSGPGIGVVAASLAVWAWRLLRLPARS